MSELIQMRQRIKAIETIKKITNAMRLIAMSMHARLRSKRGYLEEYTQGIETVFAKIKNSQNITTHSLLWPDEKQSQRHLIIIIGSQKGLCGNFNTHLAAFFAHQIVLKPLADLDLIIVGKRIIDILDNFKANTIMQFNAINYNNSVTVGHKITDHIISRRPSYQSVTIFYNAPKTFFIQKPQAIPIIPFEQKIAQPETKEPFHWEYEPTKLLQTLQENLIFSRIYQALVQSLIAEQSARFIAMDSSTRNATNLLDTMRLNYNKLRQTKITRELTDLVGSIQ